jgi:GT2 family glycosyltransferase
LIVVDNGSSDGTDDYLRHCDASVVTLTQGENRGFACACNEGARAARGDYLFFLNNDTRVGPNWLAPLVASLADPSVSVVGSRLIYPTGGIQHASVIIVQQRDEGRLFFDHVFRHLDPESGCVLTPGDYQAVTGAAMLVRRGEFLAMGGFDEGYWNGVEDIDCCLGVRAAGKRVLYQPASRVIHDESQSGAERFSGTDQNNQRFAQKWRKKLRPDFIVEKGAVTPGPAGVVRAHGAADAEFQEALLTFARDTYL